MRKEGRRPEVLADVEGEGHVRPREARGHHLREREVLRGDHQEQGGIRDGGRRAAVHQRVLLVHPGEPEGGEGGSRLRGEVTQVGFVKSKRLVTDYG